MSAKSLYILPTDYCPLNCSHCAIEESRRKEKISLEMALIENIVDKSLEYNFQIGVISGGGEPFAMNKKTLSDIVKHFKNKNLYSKISTNGFWGTSYASAYESLKPLQDSGLDQLVISVSDGHQEYVKQEDILNIVKVCYDIKIKCVIYLVQLNTKSNLLEDLVHFFRLNKLPLPPVFSENYFIPFGNAEINYSNEDFYLQDIKYIEGRCPSMYNNICIHPNGTVTPCAMVNSLSVSNLHIGNIHTESFDSIMDKMQKNVLFRYISTIGVVRLKEIIEENTGIKFDNKYVNICHLCSTILLNNRAVDFINTLDVQMQ